MDARTMLLILTCILATVAAAPYNPAPYYDLRQNGKENIDLNIKNVAIVVVIPKKIPIPDSLAHIIIESVLGRSGNEPIAQDRADVHLMEAFVEPNTPYRVVIGSDSKGDKFVEVDKDNAIVIAGRHRSEAEADSHESDGEMKLIGATEQCGPDYKRDPVSLICQPIAETTPENNPEAIHV